MNQETGASDLWETVLKNVIRRFASKSGPHKENRFLLKKLVFRSAINDHSIDVANGTYLSNET